MLSVALKAEGGEGEDGIGTTGNNGSNGSNVKRYDNSNQFPECTMIIAVFLCLSYWEFHIMLAFFRPPPKEEDSEFVRQAMSAAKDIQDQIANGERTIDIPAVGDDM